jgi:CheY-like chemotaxis protein
LSGFEVGRRLSSKPVKEQKPVLVAVTGYKDNLTKAEASEAGFDRFITKQFSKYRFTRFTG